MYFLSLEWKGENQLEMNSWLLFCSGVPFIGRINVLTGSPIIGDASYPCRKQRTTKEVFGADAGGTTHGRKICDVFFSNNLITLNPFTPESNQSQISPPAPPEILHHTVRRTWLIIAYSDERWL